MPSVSVAPPRSSIRKIVIGAAALVVLLCAAGVLYQIIGTWLDARRFPQQGQSVNVGSFRLNIDCSGQGKPIVVLESGSGVPAIGWFKVQPEVAKFTRVCSYDRAGYGWSDPAPEPRTSMQMANELKALLDAAGEKGPYVLVAHSFGGFTIRIFNRLYPDDVIGVVLVDASHEDEDDRFNAILPDDVKDKEKKNDEWNEQMDRIFTPLGTYLGIQRLQVATGWGDPEYNRALPPEIRQELFYLRQQRKFRITQASMIAAFPESVAQVRTAGNLGDRPLIVLTAGIPYDPDPLLTKELMEKVSNLWINELQAQEARLSTRGKQIVVPDSTHMIPYERPDAVVSAIREVWSRVKQQADGARPPDQ